MEVFSYDFGFPGMVYFPLFEVPLEPCLNECRYCNKRTPPPPAHFKVLNVIGENKSLKKWD